MDGAQDAQKVLLEGTVGIFQYFLTTLLLCIFFLSGEVDFTAEASDSVPAAPAAKAQALAHTLPISRARASPPANQQSPCKSPGQSAEPVQVPWPISRAHARLGNGSWLPRESTLKSGAAGMLHFHRQERQGFLEQHPMPRASS